MRKEQSIIFYLLLYILHFSNCYGEELKPNDNPNQGFKPIPNGSVKPCPELECKCKYVDWYAVEGAVCLECSRGKKVTLGVIDKILGPCYTNANCPEHGILVQKFELIGEVQRRIVGYATYHRYAREETNPSGICDSCPPCVDTLGSCIETATYPCIVVDPVVEKKPVGEPKCECQIPV